MYPDRKKLYGLSLATFAVLLLALFAPRGTGRVLAAFLLPPAAALTVLLIKKRTARSMNTSQVLMIVSVVALLYVMVYYLSGLYFGFVKTPYGIHRGDIAARFIIPIAAIIVATEIIRYVLCTQQNTLAAVMAYAIGVMGDVLIRSNIAGITVFSTFMDVLGLALFPSLMAGLLFNYLCTRYGFLPSTVYRLLTVWVLYLIPYGSGASPSIVSLVNMLLPLAVYLFIDALFEKKRKYALEKPGLFKTIFSRGLTAAAIIIMAGFVMLISNQFFYGALVIATPSMTGELNKGDAVIYKQVEDGQTIEVGQILVFEKNDSTTVHRVVDIVIINGQTRYTTKGDANEMNDMGYITDANIVGIVEAKIPMAGYPTLWLRSLFER